MNMTLELLVCGNYCPITGLKIVDYDDNPKTDEQVKKRRERQKRNYNPEKRKLQRNKKNKNASSNIPT